MQEEQTRQEKIDKILLNMALYFGHELVPDTIDVYHKLFADYSHEQINSACWEWMYANQWFPRANEIIKIIEHNSDPQPSIQSRAQQQWRIVLSAVATQGKNNPPKFSDPITANLVRTQFRWPYLCDMKQENENWEQKRWCEAFELAIESHPDMKQLEAPAKVKKLAASVTKPVTEPESTAPNSVPIKKFRELRKKLRGQVQEQEDREARMAKLKEQALQIQEKEIEKNERESVEQNNE
jgi:hypothetical protein